MSRVKNILKALRKVFNRKSKFTKLTYLAGPMDDVSIGESRDWREMLSVKLPEYGVGVFNPISKYGVEYGNVRKRFANWQKSGNVEAIRKVVASQIIPPDLELVERCDFVTLWIPPEGVEICGSYGEITHAFKLGIPVFIVTARRLKPLNVPKWAIGCSTELFKDWDDYLEFIKNTMVA